MLGRVATGVSIVLGYPLAFKGLYNAARGLVPALATDALHAPLTLGLLACITALALALQDIAVIVGLSGSLFGASLMYVAPPFLYSAAVPGASPALWALVPLGGFLAVLGTVQTLKAA